MLCNFPSWMITFQCIFLYEYFCYKCSVVLYVLPHWNIHDTASHLSITMNRFCKNSAYVMCYNFHCRTLCMYPSNICISWIFVLCYFLCLFNLCIFNHAGHLYVILTFSIIFFVVLMIWNLFNHHVATRSHKHTVYLFIRHL